MRSWLSHLRSYRAFAAALILAIGVCQTVSSCADRASSDNHDPVPNSNINPNSGDDRGPVLLSFATVGDSRQDPTKPDPTTLPLSGQDSIWLQNTRAWSRIINSIDAQHPHFLFFNGDMIMGYAKADVPPVTSSVAAIVSSDLMQFYRQYAFWRGMVASLMEDSTYVIPVAGNHEVQCNQAVQSTCASGKHALKVNEDAWRANMGDLILDDQRFLNLFGEKASDVNVSNNGPTDNLTTDQSKLSYSFDFRGSHFVVINTDPVGNDAHAPTNWLAADLRAAQGRGAQHFFVFGHKPAYTYYFGPGNSLPTSPSGLDGDTASRDAFWNVIEQYGATYFCGHEHIFNAYR